MNIIQKKSSKKRKRKVSVRTDYFCRENIKIIDFRDIKLLKRFINPQGRIVPQFFTRLLRKNQNKISLSIRRARQMALLPYQIVLQKKIEKQKQEENEVLQN